MSIVVNSGQILFVDISWVDDAGNTQSGSYLAGNGETVFMPGVFTVTDVTVNAGGSLELFDTGGTAINTTVNTSGLLEGEGVFSGTVLSGGDMNVQSGGVAQETTILADGVETVDFGGSDFGAIISSVQDVGGFGTATASGAMVFSGGLQVVLTGGTVIGTVVSSGGGLGVEGGSASNATIDDGGTEAIFAGGIDSDATINGGIQGVGEGEAGTAIGAVINNGGTQEVFAGGVASNTTISNDGTQIVGLLSGGTAIGTTVLSGGLLELLGGATATDFTISTGGTLAIGLGYTLTDYFVSADTTLVVSTGGTAIGTTVDGDEIILSGGAASDTTIEGGGSETISAGGADSGAIIESGGTQDVLGVAVDVEIQSGGTQIVEVGGLASGTTDVLSGGQQIVSGNAVGTDLSGGIEYVYGSDFGATILREGMQIVEGGGNTTSAEVDTGGNQIVHGTALATTVDQGGLQDVLGSAAGTVVSGEEDVLLGGITTSTTVSSGGLETVAGVAANTVISSGGFEVISSGGFATDTVLQSGGTIDVTFLPYVSGGSAGVDLGNLLTVSQGGNTYTQQMAGDYTGEFFQLAPDGSGGTDIFLSNAPCFCAGTRILTEAGESPVEHLAIGQRVVTLAGQARPIAWIGYRRLDLHRHPAPEQAQPILIRAHALAEDVPRRNLQLSPDHAVLIDRGLVPIRLLINGASIQRNTGTRIVTYYHIELDTHDIVLAENLPAETYLDTGNRGLFVNSDKPLVLHPDLTDGTDYPTREAGSCAPFMWDEASVRPVWKCLADRAATIGYPVPKHAITTDPDPRLLANQRCIKPVHRDSNLVIFALPRDVREVSLLSLAQSPTEARPWLEDRRRLGICVKRIVLRGMNERREIPMDHPSLTEGWWDIERDGHMMSRWTNGKAVVPLLLMDGPVILEIHLAGEMIYAVETEPESRAERRPA